VKTRLTALLLGLLTVPLAAQGDPIRRASERLGHLVARPGGTDETMFLHEQAESLIERWRRAPAGSFQAERLELATDDLLDASEHLLAARGLRPGGEADEETRRLMARDLERTYFRLREGAYFAGQAQERNAQQYVVAARRIYQLARAAYDEREYARVRLLSEGAREIISGLERLAQAAFGVPDPPRLPEG
jgi:hypothetical protein